MVVKYVLNKKELSLLGLCFLAAGLGLGFIHPLSIFLVTEQLGLPKENLAMVVYGQWNWNDIRRSSCHDFCQNSRSAKADHFRNVVNALGLAVMGFSTNLWITLTAEFVNGLMLPCIQIGINTMILQRTEGAYIGRVNGILMPLFTGSMVLTMSMAGIVKEQFSLVAIFEVAAVLFIIGMAAILPLYNQGMETKLDEMNLQE